MSILIDFFIADKNEPPKYDCHADFPSEDRCQLTSLTSLEIAGIYAALKGDEDAIELMDEFSPVISDNEDEFIEAIPDEFITLLSNIQDGDLKSIAEKCALETEEELAWEPSSFEPILRQLRQLSLRALEQSKGIYFWSSL